MVAMDIYSLVGFVGMACIIGAYAYLTVSLLVHTNWPSLVLEGFWAAIAIWGLAKALRTRSAPSQEEPQP